jgi:hypothetical protein
MFHLSNQFTAMEPSNAIASLDKVRILDGLIILNALFDILIGSPPFHLGNSIHPVGDLQRPPLRE